MNTETSQLNLIPQLLQSIDEGKRMAYRSLWDVYMSFLTEHWAAIAILLIVIFIVAIVRAFTGYWAMLGKALYNFLYFGILFVIGLFKGPEVFVSEYFDLLCLALLYPICYFTVGKILDWLGVRSRY